MTEEEAKTKWCPIAQISFQIYPGEGRSERQECIASACMMWRWQLKPYEPDRTIAHQSRVATLEHFGYKRGDPCPEKGDGYIKMELPGYVGSGYCGWDGS